MTDIKIEQAVLGCCVIDHKLFNSIMDYPENYFYQAKSQKLFKMMLELKRDETEFDLTILMPKSDDDMKVFIADCCENVTHTFKFNTYLSELSKIKIKRDLVFIGNDIGNKMTAKEYEGIDINGLINSLSQKLLSMGSKKKEDKRQEFEDILTEYEELKKAGFEMKTGFRKADDMINGFRRGRLYLLGGSAGEGKTGLALFMAQNLAYKQNKKVLFFSLEMSKFDIVGRLASILYKVPHYRIQKPWLLQKEDFLNLQNTISKIYKSNLTLESDNWTIAEILKKIQDDKSDIVFIDHLQYIPQQNNGKEKTNEILGNFIKQLRDLTKKQNICTVLLAQTKRKERLDSKPHKSDFAGTSEAERQADLGMIIRRGKPASERSKLNFEPPANYWELWIVKNRNGICGHVAMTFNEETLSYGEFTTIENDNVMEAEILSEKDIIYEEEF